MEKTKSLCVYNVSDADREMFLDALTEIEMILENL